MKKSRVLITWILVAAVLAAGATGIAMKKNHDNKVLASEEQRWQLAQTYYNQNVAFKLYMYGVYRPMSYIEGTEKGIYSEGYFDLACYKKLTGNELTYEQAREYLSQEYEDDGELRIYNNGRHPKIEKYVEWALKNEDVLSQYNLHVGGIYRSYVYSYDNVMWNKKWDDARVYVRYRNQAIMDELIKKEADPDYVMDEEIMWGGLLYGPLLAQRTKEQRQLAHIYYYQNLAFRLYTTDRYHPMEYREGLEEGIYWERYFDLAYYKKLRGNELTYEQVRKYLSQEYEDDGELRLYNNGRHPEIEKYVKWSLKNADARSRYSRDVESIYYDYLHSYDNDVWLEKWIRAGGYVKYRNQAILDELIKKEADPDYVMDEEIMWGGLDYGPLV